LPEEPEGRGSESRPVHHIHRFSSLVLPEFLAVSRPNRSDLRPGPFRVCEIL
jgi:hypothetical protein